MVARDVPYEKTDAEQMSDIIKEVQEEPKEANSEEPAVVKPKAKRASRAKPIFTLQVSDHMEEEPKEEPKEEAKEEPKEVLTLPGVDQRE